MVGVRPWLVLIESNTTGSGRYFCAAARSRGLRPLVLVGAPERYAYLARDRVSARVVDTSDTEAVLRACHDLRASAPVVGVTSSSDYFVDRAALAAESLGLPAPDAAAVARCRDKASQRAILTRAGLAVPPFHAVADPAEAARMAADLGLPVVVKPVIGSGSVGVRLCRTAAEARQSAAEILSGAATGRPAGCLVEAYVRGAEYSVETFGLEATAVVAKRLGRLPYFVEVGHDLQVATGSDEHVRLADAARRALTALGLGWGPAHTELRLSPGGPVIIEVNPRLAGGMIPKMIHLAGGADLVDAVIAAASGQPLPAITEPGAYGVLRFRTVGRTGTIRALHGLEAARSAPGVRYADFTCAAGDMVKVTHSFRDRLGYVICVGTDGLSTAMYADRAVRMLKVEVSAARGGATSHHPAASARGNGPGTLTRDG